MELQLVETFDLNDVDKVLNALEWHLRTDFETVERYGSQIVIFPATQPQQQQNDLTAIEALAEDGHTKLTVVVSHDSMFVSDDMTQTNLARKSIEGAIERMRVQLKAQRLQPATLTYDDLGYATTPRQTAEETTDGPPAMRSEEASPTQAEELPPAVEDKPAPRLLFGEIAGEAQSHRLAIAVTIGIILAAGTATTMLIRFPRASKSASPASVSSARTSQTEMTPTTPFISDKQFAVKPEKDLNSWVKDWAAALRSRDPEAQASYYSTEVDDYLGARTVSREFVIREKMEDLKARLPVSLIKVEHVQIERQTRSEAVVALVKHTITRSAQNDVTEIFVTSRLKLKNTRGIWTIVQEQDLRNTAAKAVNGKKQWWPASSQGRSG